MPAKLQDGVVSKKRKRVSAVEKTRSDAVAKAKKVAKPQPSSASPSAEEVLQLEEAIVESPKGYNNIVALLEYAQNLPENPELAVTSSVSLCRAFCRLMAKGSLTKRKGDDEASAQITGWLKERYKDYTRELCTLLGNEDPAVQSTALTLLMRLVKEEAAHLKPVGDELHFPHVLFAKLVKALVYAERLDEGVKREFVEKYLNQYDDIRYSFYMAVSTLGTEASSDAATLPHFTDAALSFMVALNNLPTADTDLLDAHYAITPPPSSSSKKTKPSLLHKPAHRKQLQETWLSLLRLPLSPPNTKSLLLTMSTHIAPSFLRPTLLMDFLVDSYSSGGTIALLALNGLFYLISTKNLDYPNFYPALYALLTRDVLHVRYRSRFFRLLETFLSSTHLPAALIASFIKKLSRLSLTAPPAAVVVIVPFVYNLLKKHPSCTFMLHRVGSADERERWRREGVKDPFREEEKDPGKTGALESCLWELEMARGHWQPNVATIARILGEQFTKERYEVEDFLGHSYASMFDAEIKKAIKKPPVVEFDIPKKIFFEAEAAAASGPAGEEEDGLLPVKENKLLSLWSFE